MARVEKITRESMRPLIAPFGLAEAVRAGDILFIGGQIGLDETHHLVDGGLKAQAAQAFRNIRAIVELAGGQPGNIVQFTWFLATGARDKSVMDQAVAVTAAREEVLPGLVTASTAVRVQALLTPEILVEISAVAAL